MAGLSLLLALWALLPSVLGQGLEEFFDASGDVVRGTAPETRIYWQSHLTTSRERILQAADLADGTDTATVLGAGLGMEIPLAELARRFERLILVDLDGRSMLQGLRQVPSELRAKVDLKVMDVTSFAGPLIERIEQAVEMSSTSEEAFERFGVILDGLGAGDRPSLPESDFVVSSLLLSEIPRYPFSYAAQAIKTRYGVTLQTWDRSDQFFRRLVEISIEDHVQLLAELVSPGGVVYFSDTIARGLANKAQTEAVRRAVEAQAAPELIGLGIADSAEGVTSAVNGLCRARHSPASEAEAFEQLLTKYREADGRFFEPLLPVGEIGAQCSKRGLELRGEPESWWWLAYPCKILRGSGAFLVSNWVLGLRN